MQLKRFQYIDLAKGILIVLVVLGHSDFVQKSFVYWFHMPAFFIVSGILHKQPAHNQIIPNLRRKAKNFLWPYFAFGLVVVTIITVYSSFFLHQGNFIKAWGIMLVRLTYSGTLLFSAISPFWFVPTLFLTVVAFTLLKRYIKKDVFIQLVLIASFIAGIFAGSRFHKHIPWHADVVPVSVFYYGTGYYFKNFVFAINNKPYKTLLAFCLFILCSLILWFGVNGYFHFSLDMKYSIYSSYFLAVIIPFLFTGFILVSSMLIENSLIGKALAYAGFNSMVIMYLHFPVNNGIIEILKTNYNPAIFVIIGVLAPLIIDYLIKRSNMLTRIFYGSQQKLVEKYPGAVPVT